MNNLERKIRWSWAGLGVGLLVMLAGLSVRWLTELPWQTARPVIAVGLVLAGSCAGSLVRALALRADPRQAKRLLAAEGDERALAVRGRAAVWGFWSGIAVSGLALLIVSFQYANPPMDVDSIWFLMAGVVVLPLVFYVAGLLYYDRQL